MIPHQFQIWFLNYINPWACLSFQTCSAPVRALMDVAMLSEQFIKAPELQPQTISRNRMLRQVSQLRLRLSLTELSSRRTVTQGCVPMASICKVLMARQTLCKLAKKSLFQQELTEARLSSSDLGLVLSKRLNISESNPTLIFQALEKT